MFRIIKLIFLLFFVLETSGQFSQLTFHHVTRSNGLPVDVITALAQDSSGFIWIGSKEGLFRYDGFTFKSYTNNNSQSGLSIPDNSVTNIIVARNGNLWIGTEGGGIACMKRNGQIIEVYNSSTNKLITNLADHVTEIKEDKSGNIWWTTTDGFFFLSTSKKLQCYKLKSNNSRGNLFSNFIFDDHQNIWITGIPGIFNFRPGSKSFETLNRFKEINHVGANSQISFNGDNLWYTGWLPSLGLYDTLNRKQQLLYTGQGSAKPDFFKMANQFYQDSRKNLWIATGKGLFFVRQNEHQPSYSFFSEPGNNYSIISSSVNCVLEDRDGNFWVGTDRGVSIARPYKQKVINLSYNAVKEFPFGNMNITDIIPIARDKLLLGTQYADGIYQIGPDFKVSRRYSFNDVRYDWAWTHYDDIIRNRILISTQEGMLEYDKKSGDLNKNTEPIFNDRMPVSSMVPQNDSIIWFSKFWGIIHRYNLDNGTFKKINLTEFGFPKQVLYLAKASPNSIWLIAHHSGLYEFDMNSEKLIDSITLHTKPSLRQPNLMFVHDLGDEILVGYRSKGFSLFNKKNKNFRHFSQTNGLVSDNTSAVFFENKERVWIATRNGISLFNTNTKTFINYNFEDGLLSNDISTITKLPDGRMAAGTTQGLVVFDPQLNDPGANLPSPFITSLNIYGKNVDPNNLQDGPVTISYKENYFSFDYISLQYYNNAEIEYAYKLEGFNNDWITAGKRRFGSYSNLEGGNYTLKIRARRLGGNWVESSSAIQLQVSSPFYSKWWFYLASIIAIAALVYALFRYRMRQLLKMEKMRSVISSDLHDEVGASLTSISIYSEMARQSLPGNSSENILLQRIGERSRESIEKMGDIIWSINPEHDSLQQMLVRMKNYALEMTEATAVGMHWSETGKLEEIKLDMQQRKDFYLLFKEAINNIIKHAGAKNVWVNLIGSSSLVKMTIEDDGKGFDVLTVKKGNGIKNMQARAANLGSKLKVHSVEGKGTQVDISFPC